MRVNLAAQVLSKLVNNVLNFFGPEEAPGTGKFCITVHSFFNCVNVKNTTEQTTKRKPFLNPNFWIDDSRLGEFIHCFELGKISIEVKNYENYTENVRFQYFIAERWMITDYSFVISRDL